MPVEVASVPVLLPSSSSSNNSGFSGYCGRRHCAKSMGGREESGELVRGGRNPEMLFIAGATSRCIIAHVRWR
jgi:hypothetical protein